MRGWKKVFYANINKKTPKRLVRMWRKGNPHALWWDRKLVQPLWKTERRSPPPKLKIVLSYGSAISLLGIYPTKTKKLIQKDICTPMFTATLFTVMKRCKQPKCLLIYEWIKKMHVHMHNGILLSHKKNEILLFATRILLESIILSEISQTKQNTM